MPQKPDVSRHARRGGSQVIALLRTDRAASALRLLLRFVASPVGLGLLLTILAWPYDTPALLAKPGLDPSWQASLQMAAQQQLPFGSEFAFAYGPLGFLSVVPIYGDATAVLAWLYVVSLSTALFGILVWSLRRQLPLAVALVVALVVGQVCTNLVLDNFTGETEKATVITFAVCVALLLRPSSGRDVRRWEWVALGAASALFFLVKMSVGASMGMLVIVSAVAVGRGWAPRLGMVMAGGGSTFLALWFATGNGLGNLPDFTRSTLQIVAGYTPAVALEQPGRGFTYWLAALDVAVVVALAALRTRDLDRRTRLGLGVITALALWFLFKEGFVRHDRYHDAVFFAAVPVVVIGLLPAGRRVVSLVAVTIAVTTAAVAAEDTSRLWPRPVAGIGNFAAHASDVLAPERRATIRDAAKGSLQATYGLPQDMVTLMQGNTVTVDPWEQSVLWAYPGVTFNPLPGVQGYSTYTSALDRLNVEFLGSDRAPRYILRQVPAAFDSRNPVFEPPSTQVEIFCRYHQVRSSEAWQLVERGPNRCASPRLITTTSAGFGEWITAPAVPAGSILAVRVQLSLSPWWRLRSALFKPTAVHVSVDGGRSQYRFIAGTSESLHLLAAPQSLGYDIGFSPPRIGSLNFTVGDQGTSSSGVRLTFLAIPMVAAPGAP